jgi:hypothetical protein
MVTQSFLCTPWVTFFALIAAFNTFWISCLFICHIYQVLNFFKLFKYKCLFIFFQAVFAAMTTNERMNGYRYKHFTDEKGRFQNPFK